ncbi:hypothetical protein niasHS_006184 [Heterodera schachtii]|uniref:F-box domain-containing protein n=1 Tax=Heterodera schachtii TaxID=97005 RepID=A0ABD2JSI2_HETSC
MDNGALNDQIWLDTLAWLVRGEVGTHMALVNARFAILVDTQLLQRQWWLKELHISEREPIGTGAEAMIVNSDGSRFSSPLPTEQLPENVVGFNRINIRYFDTEVINFLHRIRRLFSTDISLQFDFRLTQTRGWRSMARHIWPLLKNGLIMLVNLKRLHLTRMHKYISPTVLFDCAELFQISSTVLPESPTTYSTSPNLSTRLLYNWLHTPRPDGRPVVFKLTKWKSGWENFVNELITVVLHSCGRPGQVHVLASFDFNYTRSEQMVNTMTEEKLTLSSDVHQRPDGGFVSSVKILRCPAVFTEANVMSWLRLPRVAGEWHPNLVTIGFSDD